MTSLVHSNMINLDPTKMYRVEHIKDRKKRVKFYLPGDARAEFRTLCTGGAIDLRAKDVTTNQVALLEESVLAYLVVHSGNDLYIRQFANELERLRIEKKVYWKNVDGGGDNFPPIWDR